jgi:myo-inositol catabolism protein IolC
MDMPRLFMLPFDHRGTFQEKLFGWKEATLTKTQAASITKAKWLVYQGFLETSRRLTHPEWLGILVDEQYGQSIFEDAKARSFITACPVERSGQEVFDFEYGEDFKAHLRQMKPTYAKVLVRHHPHLEHTQQLERLKRLSDFCLEEGPQLMFELLVPPLPNEAPDFDLERRPSLVVEAIQQIQEAGIEPALWKIEGADTSSQLERIRDQVRAGGRKSEIILLGRGESMERVSHWLSLAAPIEGFIGFAIGRTLFWDALKKWHKGEWDEETTTLFIAKEYEKMCTLYASLQSVRP